MRTLTSGTLTVLAYDARVWKQERNVLHVTDESATQCSVCFPTLGDVLATYTLDAAHKVTIDLSDLIRVHAEAGAHDLFVRTDGGAAQYVKADYEVAGLISPEHVLIPANDTGAPIVPPSVVLEHVGSAENAVEFYAREQIRVTVGTREQLVQAYTPKSIAGAQSYVLPSSGKMYAIKTQPLACGRTYASVRWQSFTGQTRVATWEVVKGKTATMGALGIIDLGRSDETIGHKTIKGREDGFTLHLDGLSAYDAWYYGDIVTSSKVEVSLDGETWRLVDVATKEANTPDGNSGKLAAIDVAVIYAQYDAVSM